MSELKRLQDLFSRGTISRREFMAQAAALGVAATVPALASESALAAMPRKGGHFKIGIGAGSTTDSLDPATYLDTYMQTVGHGFQSYLMEVNDKSEAIPALAASNCFGKGDSWT